MNIAGIGQIISIGTHNAVTADGLHKNIETTLTFVSAETDLASITDVEPGDIAATYGFGDIWQYDGTQWVEV